LLLLISAPAEVAVAELAAAVAATSAVVVATLVVQRLHPEAITSLNSP
jgi:hypothetical protein